MPLTDTRIRNAKPKPKPYKLSDGAGLYLLIMPGGARYWRMDYRFAGKRRTLALGVYPEVPLAQARARRKEARASLARDADPSAVKKATKRAARLASVNTFEAVARDWLDNRGTSLSPATASGYRGGWKRISFRRSARGPLLGSKPRTCWRRSREWRDVARSRWPSDYGRSAVRSSDMRSPAGAQSTTPPWTSEGR